MGHTHFTGAMQDFPPSPLSPPLVVKLLVYSWSFLLLDLIPQSICHTWLILMDSSSVLMDTLFMCWPQLESMQARHHVLMWHAWHLVTQLVSCAAFSSWELVALENYVAKGQSKGEIEKPFVAVHIAGLMKVHACSIPYHVSFHVMYHVCGHFMYTSW